MINNSYLKGKRTASRRPWDIVVPVDTSSLVTQRDPADAISKYVDTIFAPEYNSLFPGLYVTRKSVKTRRSIFFVLRTSSAISGAPAAVVSHAATLASKNTQAFSIDAVKNGDIWIVGNTADAIRHGGYDLLLRLGVEYLNPHPAWRVIVSRNSWELEASEVKEPKYESFVYAGNGGFTSASVPLPAGTVQDYAKLWYTWWAQKRMPVPRNGFGDGDEAFTTHRQDQLRHERTQMLAYTPGHARGWSAPTGNFPAVQFTGDITTAKLCNTHHGLSGAYPSPPAGPDVWTGVTNQTQDATHYSPGGPLSADARSDTGINESTSYLWFGGGIAMHAVQHFEVACVRLQLYGYPHVNTCYVTSEPNDGDENCQCDRCIDLLRNGPYATWLTVLQRTQDSSVSDRVWHQMNEDQKYLQNQFTNALIPGTSTHFCPGSGMLAYTGHAAPPNIPIHTNSITVILPKSSAAANVLSSELEDLWAVKRANNAWGTFALGIQPQWELTDVNYGGLYWPDPLSAARLNTKWMNDGMVLLQAQSGFSGMTMGIVWWLLVKQLWDTSIDSAAMLDRWFELAFGPAKAAVRAMHDRAWQWWERTQHEIGHMARDADAALTALNAATDPLPYGGREAIRSRLDQWRAWVHFQRLALDFDDARQFFSDGQLDASGPGTPPRIFISGNRVKPACFAIEILTSTTYRYTRNADHPTPLWEETGLTIVPGGSHPLGGVYGVDPNATNCFVNFPTTGTYTAGQIYSQVGPVNRVHSTTDALSAWCWKTLRFCGVHNDRVARSAWFSIPHPVSLAVEGTSPPLISIGDPFTSTTPTAGTAYIDIEVTTGGTNTTAVFQWRRNGGTFTTGVTMAASKVLAGCTVFFPAGTYTTAHKYHFTVDTNKEKWNEADNSSTANWSTLTEPTRSDIDAAITADIAAYVPVIGVSRLVDPMTSFRSFNTSGSTTLHDTVLCDTPQKWIIKTPANPTTVKVKISCKSAFVGLPIRIVLKDMSGNVLQSQTYANPGSTSTFTYDFTITQPAGTYQLINTASQGSGAYLWFSFPENVGAVWVTDDYDAPAHGYGSAVRSYFYVPTGQTKIVMCFNTIGQVSGDDTHRISILDPSGTPVAVTRVGLSQWVCDVGAGQDNSVWSFYGNYSRSENNPVRFENCPNRIAFSPYQLLIP